MQVRGAIRPVFSAVCLILVAFVVIGSFLVSPSSRHAFRMISCRHPLSFCGSNRINLDRGLFLWAGDSGC